MLLSGVLSLVVLDTFAKSYVDAVTVQVEECFYKETFRTKIVDFQFVPNRFQIFILPKFQKFRFRSRLLEILRAGMKLMTIRQLPTRHLDTPTRLPMRMSRNRKRNRNKCPQEHLW